MRAGLGWETVRWAFGRMHDNWHPLTSLSHAALWHVFGDAPAAHHVANVLVHAANAALVVIVLHALGADVPRAAAVALLFALHPLRVESVAWVTERKDVLSGLGFLLTVWAYVTWARRPTRGRAIAVGVAFLGALLAKPMVVTTPIVLLVLDRWPLRRTEPLARLLREKIPLVLLAAASSVVTVLAQRQGGAVTTLDVLPLRWRLANAVVSVPRYLGAMLWPTDLAYFYPYRLWPWTTVAGAIALLVLVTGGAWMLRRARPYVLAGWIWWLVMLAPVIGVLQVGEQSMADRYTYLPSLGLLIAAVWWAGDFATTPARRACAVTAAVLAIGASIATTRVQLSTWRDSETAARHALAVTTRNYVAHRNLALALAARGDRDGARKEYESALALKPDDAAVLVSLGDGALHDERWDAAADYFERALALDPGFTKARGNRAEALAKTGRVDEAIAVYRAAIADDPTLGFELGNLEFSRGHAPAAIAAWRAVLAVEPTWHTVRDNVAVALLALDRPDEAIAELERVVGEEPQHQRAQRHLGMALARVGRRDEALAALRRAVALDADDREAARALADLEGR